MASKIVEAVKNLYKKTVQANEQAAKANMAVQQAEVKKVQDTAKKVYSNLQKQQESAARSQIQQDRAKTQQAKTNTTKVQSAVRNLYQQAAAQQQRAVQADMAVRQAGTKRVQDAVQGLYSAYQRQQEQQTISQLRQAQEERAAAQRLYSGIRDATVTGQRNAAQADMAVQQAQSQRLQSALQAIYNAASRQQEQAARAQVEQDRARMEAGRNLYQQTLQRQQQAARADLDVQRARPYSMQDIYSAALDKVNEIPDALAGSKMFNAIPGELARTMAFDQNNEDAMQAEMLRYGYTRDQIADVIENLRQNPVDQYARYKDVEGDTFFGQARANFELGDLQQQADILLGQGILQGNQEWIQRGMELRALAEQYAQNNSEALGRDSGWLGNMIAENMAQYAPQFLYQQIASLPGQAVAMLAPNKYTTAAAQAFGSGSLSFTTMAGAAYENLTEKGAEAEKAATMAKDEAFISSLIESGDTFADFAFGPMEGINPFAKIGEAATKKLAGRMAIGFGKWALNVGQEYSEEAMQELVSMANERRLAEGGGDGGVTELLGYFFDECRQKYPELFELYKKDALGVFFGIDKMKEQFPDLYAEYQGIKPTEEAERLNQAGTGGAVIGAFMGLFGSATGAVRSGINRTQANRAFDALVANTDQEALGSLTNDQLTEAMESARSLNRTDAVEILEAEQARRDGRQGREDPSSAPDGAPSPEGEDIATAQNENAQAENGRGVGRFSIETNPDGTRYVKADRKVLEGDDPAQWGKQLERYINEQIRNGEDVVFTTEDGHEIKLTERTAYKMSDQHKPNSEEYLSDDQYNLKENAAGHIDELIQTASFDRHRDDKGNKHTNDIGEDGFNYFNAYYEDGDGNYYQVPISVGVNDQEETAYSIGEIRRRTRTSPGSSAQRVTSASDFSGAQNSGAGSSDTVYTSNQRQSQEEMTPMQRAFEDALRRKGANYEDIYDNRSEDGNADQRAGGQAGAGTDQTDAGAGSRSQGEVSQGVREAGGSDLRNGREVTPAELGIPGGSEADSVTVLDLDNQSGSISAAADQVRSAGLEPVAFAGDMKVNGVSVNGYIQDGKVFFRTDGSTDADSIVKHELFHNAVDADPSIVDAANEIIKGKMSREEFLRMEQDYFDAYKDLYAWETMDDDAVLHRIHEEIAADAYAGMNRFRNESRIVEAVREDMAQRNSQNAEAQRDATGPPEGRAAREPGSKPRFDANSNDVILHREDGTEVSRKEILREHVSEIDSKLGDKSPFRDGFEDRLRKDQSPIKDVKIDAPAEVKNTRKKDFRTKAADTHLFPSMTVKNEDTGISIAVGSHGYTDSALYAGYYNAKETFEALSGIDRLIKNAKLVGVIDTSIDGNKGLKGRNNPHRLYQYILATPCDVGNGRRIAIMRIDALYAHGGTDPRFYNLRTLEIKEASSGSSKTLVKGVTDLKSASIINVAQMVSLVNPDIVGNHVTNAQPGMFSVDVNGMTTEERKQRQVEIILKNNPHDDALGEHTWIRGAEDVHTFEEGLSEDGIEDGDGVTPDYTADMIAEAKRTGEITVYSSHPIKAGTFVTPSAMEARSYAGSGPIYSQTIRTDDVAWLDSIQGQYAPVTEESEKKTRGRGSASIEVPGRTAAEIRREIRERTEAVQRANDANDDDFDFRGEGARITELMEELERMENPSSAGQSPAPSPQGEGMEAGSAAQGEGMVADDHPERGELYKNGVRICKDTEALEAELNEIGEAKLRNDTGEYRARLRRKNEGGVLLTVDRDGKRDLSRTFGNAEEAAAFARAYIDGQTRARTDAELDENKSEKIPQQTLTEELFSGEEQDETARLKKNKAAEASTQALRERIRKTDAEIRALRRLQKTTGLTDTQKAHMDDLQQSLEILNDELTSRKGRARDKKKTVEVNGNKPVRSAAEAKNALFELFHTAQGERTETGRKIDQKLAEITRSGHITEESRQELFDMLMDAGAVREEAAEELRDVRSWLRGARIYVSEHDRADFGDNWNALRRRAWANGIYLTDNLTDRKADSLNAELAETFGEGMFPTDAAPSDMLANLVDKAEAGRSQMIPFAEAIESEARNTRTDPQEIYNELSQKLDETLRSFGEKAGLEVDLKNRTASMLETERKRMEDRLERQAQRRRESQIREKTLKALQRLEKLRGKAANDVREQIDEALKDIDTHARTLTMSGIEDLQELQRVYDEAKAAAGYVDEDNPGNFLHNPYVEEKLAALGKKHLNDMDISDVIELGRVVASLENTIRTQNQMIGEEFDQKIDEMANAVNRDVSAAKGAKPGFWQKWTKEEHLSPRRFLEMLGGWKKDGAMGRLAQSLENGQTRMLDFQRRAMQSFDPFMSRKENRKWLETASGKKATWTTYGVVNGMAMDGSGFTGDTIEITPMMKIALYLHAQNEDNLRHIQTGGLVIPNKELYKKGKLQEAYAQGTKVKMQPQAVRAIASTLTQQEKTFAGYLQKFFNQTSKEAINEVSLQLDGFERANVDNYFPIESSRSYLKSDVAGEARAATVEGIGSIANERVHAGNPIVLSDASDVLMRQIDNVSKYYGLAIPIRDFQAVNNFVFHEEGNAFAGSIKDTINRKWGAGAENYITKMLADLQSNSRRSDMMSSALARLRGHLAGATLGINPSVALSQTASYPGAAQVVGWDGLAAGLTAGRVDTKLIEKYTPLYWYRNQGNSTQELGDSIKGQSLEQKLPWLMNWIQKMDSATIRRLWAAAEYRVSKDNPGLKPGSKAEIDAGTDAYYKAVAEVFNRAVYDTQPNYTNMERAQILRSDSDLTKMLTMYKTVPLQYYGMMVEATGRLQAAARSGDKAQLAEARRYAANTFGGLLAANSVYVIMKALIGKGFRKKDDDYRDEEGNLTLGSVTKQLGKDLAETYAGSIIGGAEAYSLAEAWITGGKFTGPELSALGQVEDIVNDIGSIYQNIDDGDERKAAKAIKTAALDIATAYGLPLKNLETYLLASIRWISPETAMEYDNMFGGIEKGDLKKMDEETTGIGANLILRNRTGESLDRSATDELARLYSAGYDTSIPTNIPSSFTYDGNEVEIPDRGAYSDAWGEIVGDNLEELLSSRDYADADDKTKAAMINKLYQYATVQARMDADPEYSAEGNSTYGWTVKADMALDAQIDLPTAIGALTAFGTITADKDESGASISGSKKQKVVDYIDGLDLDNEQKDLLFELAGYSKGLEETPWHTGASGSAGASGTAAGTAAGTGKKTAKAYQDALEKAKADPNYTAPSWTIWAGTAIDAGIDLESALTHLNALDSFKADYDEYGKTITGSKKKKVCDYIDALDLTPDQKDVLYLRIYNENSLRYTPWHGYTEGKKSKKRRRGGRRGGGRRRKAAAPKAVKPVQVGQLAKGYDTGIDIRTLFGGNAGSTGKKNSASAGLDLLDIVNQYYDGNPLAAAMDGGRKARTSVDFKL